MKSECCWNDDRSSLCKGEVLEREIFEKQVNANLCERHYNYHKNLMILSTQGYELERLIELNISELEDKVEDLINRGFDIDNCVV